MNPNVKLNRDKYIGGSDIPAIMGISKFKSRNALLKEKAGIIINEFKGSIFTDYGNTMEPKVRKHISSEMETEFVEDCLIFEDHSVRCNVDGINDTHILEIKTTGKLKGNIREYEDYLVQLLFYMHYTGRQYGTLAVYQRPSNFSKSFESSRLEVHHIEYKTHKKMVEKMVKDVISFQEELAQLKATINKI